MSKRYLGGVITANPATPTGSFQDSAAPGMWTSAQQMQLKAAGLWPLFGNANPDSFIENLFSTYLYDGNGSTQTITNGIDLAGKGGLTWIKRRTNAASSHAFIDTIRGGSKALNSDNTSVGQTSANLITSFNSNGFSIGPYGDMTNTIGMTYASWTFRKQPKFFDVVTYTGTGVAGRTLTHNLGSVPGCVIIKRTNTTGNWTVWHRSLSGTYPSSRLYLQLNLTSEANGGSQTFTEAPTSTTLTFDDGSSGNGAGSTYVAYLFAHNAGGFGLSGNENVVSCGAFSTDSGGKATVNLGYEPQWVMFKRTDSSTFGNWYMIDNMRGFTNPSGSSWLWANTDNAEQTGINFAPESTGFNINFTGPADWIYIAIRRGPMAVPTLGTTVFNPAFYGTNGIFGYLGAPTDMSIYTSLTTPASSNPALRSRLVGGGNRVTTSNTDAEVADATNFWDNMVGANPSGEVTAFNNTRITFNFRRAPSFFDEVCYTGTGANRTVAHNLAVAPELMITKSRSGTYDWAVYAAGIGNTSYGLLNDAGQFYVDSSAWNNTSPTSSVFTVGTGTYMNGSGATYVAYLFATCAGVSKVGSYTGTGTTQAIACGFTAGARFVLIKRTDSTGDWYVWDSTRGIVAGNDPYLLLNSSAAEVTGTDYVDTSAAGFEITSTAPAAINANGGSYIFLAIS